MTGPKESLGLTEPPPGEHDSELPDGADGNGDDAQQENAGSALDQPSDDSGQ